MLPSHFIVRIYLHLFNLLTILLAWVGKQFGKLRVITAEKTDKRIHLMNEIVNGMKVIKMYTWEKSFASLVHEARK